MTINQQAQLSSDQWVPGEWFYLLFMALFGNVGMPTQVEASTGTMLNDRFFYLYLNNHLHEIMHKSWNNSQKKLLF